MPALHLFGRRWLLASDDVVAPAALVAAFSAAWAALLAAWLATVAGNDSGEEYGCAGVGAEHYAAVGALLGAYALAAALAGVAAAVAARGAVFETRRRTAVAPLLYALTAVFVAQICLNGWATHLQLSAPPACTGAGGWDPSAVFGALVWSTWAALGAAAALAAAAFNHWPRFDDARAWEARCECAALALCCGPRRSCCGKGGGGGAASAEDGPRETAHRLARLWTLMFSHIDLVPSDYLLGFGLALSEARARRRRRGALARRAAARAGASGGTAALAAAEAGGAGALGGVGAAEGGPQARPGAGAGAVTSAEGEPVDAATLEELAHFCRYAFAAYGQLLL
jgi:hypothetical protein